MLTFTHRDSFLHLFYNLRGKSSCLSGRVLPSEIFQWACPSSRENFHLILTDTMGCSRAKLHQIHFAAWDFLGQADSVNSNLNLHEGRSVLTKSPSRHCYILPSTKLKASVLVCSLCSLGDVCWPSCSLRVQSPSRGWLYAETSFPTSHLARAKSSLLGLCKSHTFQPSFVWDPLAWFLGDIQGPLKARISVVSCLYTEAGHAFLQFRESRSPRAL